MQFAHGKQRGIAHIQAVFYQVAEFQQAHAQAVAAGLGSVHKSPGCKVVQDAVGCGGVQASFFADFFQGNCVRFGGQDVDDGKHPLDHLNRGFRRNAKVCFFHEFILIRAPCILLGEIKTYLWGVDHPIAIHKNLMRPEARLVVHFGAFPDPVTEVDVRQSQFTGLRQLP